MKTGASADYNQMLVVSLFLHLLVVTIIMFLPKQKIQQKIIVPAFNFDVVDIPAQRQAAPREVGAAVKPKPEALPPAEEAKEVKPEKTPAPKPVEQAAPPAPVKKIEPRKPKAASKIVEELERLEPHEPAIVKDLDKLAKLKPPETYNNLEELKKRREEPQKALPTKKPAKKEELEEVESEPDLKKETREKSALEQLEDLKKPHLKSALEQLEDLKKPHLKSAVTQLEEFRKPEAVAKKVDLAMSANQPFSSALHKKTEVPGTGKMASLDEQAEALSLYIGVVRERVYSNWKNPLGAESKEVYVSFFLYSQGNIGKPFVEKSSGNDKLDSLAVRAILDSDPFPQFPPNLKEPSFHLTIRFKYIP